jgi:hypothetical protein
MPHRLHGFVARRAQYRCEYCLAPEILFNSEMDVEHVVPVARRGSDDEWNLALACRACNNAKHTATEARDPQTGRFVRLFNPRTDVWHAHLALDLESARIDGLTDIGRATVARLRMNGKKHREAREMWILYFGYPHGPESGSA